MKVLFLTQLLTAISVLVSGVASAQAAAPGNSDVETIRAALEKHIGDPQYAFTGAVLVIVKDGEIVVLKGYGHADASARTQVDPERTQFQIGSIGKTFTAAAIAQLLDTGRIRSIDDEANRYLPAGMKLPANRGVPITLRMLATHQAGFEEILSPDRRPDQRVPVLDRRYFAQNLPRYIVPANSGMNYSNFGASVLGIIAANLNGSSYSDVLRARIFQPLGMTGSIILDKPQAHPFLAQAQAFYANGGVRAIPSGIYSNPLMVPAGAIGATGADMGRYMISLLGGSSALSVPPITGTKGMAALYTPLAGDAPLQSLALFFKVSRWNRVELLEHGGRVLGANSQMTLIPQQKIGIFVSVTGEGDQTLPLNGLLGLPGPVKANADLAGRRVPNGSGMRGAMLTALLGPLRAETILQSGRLANVSDYSGEYISQRSPIRSVRKLFTDTFLGGPIEVKVAGRNEIIIGSRKFSQIAKDVFWSDPAWHPQAAPGLNNYARFYRNAQGNVEKFSFHYNDAVFARASGPAGQTTISRSFSLGFLIVLTGLLSLFWARGSSGRLLSASLAISLLALPVVFFRSWPDTPVAALSYTLLSPVDLRGFQVLANIAALLMVAIIVMAVASIRNTEGAGWRGRLGRWHLRILALGAVALLFGFYRYDLIGWNLA